MTCVYVVDECSFNGEFDNCDDEEMIQNCSRTCCCSYCSLNESFACNGLVVPFDCQFYNVVKP